MNASFFQPGRVAAITGAASGIGLAAAKLLASRGLRLALCDINLPQLEAAQKELIGVAAASSLERGGTTGEGAGNVIVKQVDVSNVEEVEAWKESVISTWGEVNVLMNNAATMDGGGTFGNNLGKWRNLLEINLFGVINGVQTFAPLMQSQKNQSVIINTGSKQGITCPPGNSAYNVSKAAVKTLTEQLAYELRSSSSSCSAHLFVPGWTHTGMTSGGDASKPKPDGAWTAEQTVEYAFEKIGKGDFYAICPDNDVKEELDQLRMAWSGTDPAAGRPALSRWHPDYKEKFESYIAGGDPSAAAASKFR